MHHNALLHVKPYVAAELGTVGVLINKIIASQKGSLLACITFAPNIYIAGSGVCSHAVFWRGSQLHGDAGKCMCLIRMLLIVLVVTIRAKLELVWC